jgi:hypothetical protein
MGYSGGCKGFNGMEEYGKMFMYADFQTAYNTDSR